jgi:hypothetical protein
MAELPWPKEKADLLVQKGGLTQEYVDNLYNVDPSAGIQNAIDAGIVSGPKPVAPVVAPSAAPPKTLDQLEAETWADAGKAIRNPYMPAAPAATPEDEQLMQARMQPVSSTAGLEMPNAATQAPTVDFAQMKQAQMAPYDNAFDKQRGALDMQVNAANEYGRLEAAKYTGLQEELRKEDLAAQAREQEIQKDVDTKMGEMDTIRNEISTMKVDKDRLWNNMGTGQKILAGIGLILGAAGSGGNKAVSVIESAINRDIEEQRNAIEQKGNSLKNASNMYGMFRQKLGDSRAATLATKNAAIDRVKLELAGVAAKYRGTDIAAKAQAAAAQYDMQQAQITSQVEGIIRTNAGMSAAPQNGLQAVMSLVPANLQKEAIKELGEKQGWGRLTTGLMNSYQKLNNIGFLKGSAPGILGGQSDSYDAEVANLAGAVVGNVPNIKSDADFKNIVAPMLPKRKDTPAEAKRKLQSFENFLKQNAPTTPILDGVGITREQPELKTLSRNLK